MKLFMSLVIVVLVFTSAVAAATPTVSPDFMGGVGANENTEAGPAQQDGLNESGQSQTGAPNETGQGPGPDQGQQIGQNASTPGTPQGEQVQQETQNLGENETIRVQEREEVRVQNVSELHEQIQEREREMNQEVQALAEPQQLIYQHHNKVRLAVHALVAAEELIGDTGPQVAQLAEAINASVNATIQAEERIQARNTVVRFFAGGDNQAAQEIEQQVLQNQERIQQLQQLIAACACDEEVQALLQEQLQNMEQEQSRLLQLAQQEKEDKGLFGWLWK